MLAARDGCLAAAAVTFRNPVYCAIWFGLSLLGVAGLFFFTGAPVPCRGHSGGLRRGNPGHLSVRAHAGPARGQAAYDRVSWEALLSAVAGSCMVGICR